MADKRASPKTKRKTLRKRTSNEEVKYVIEINSWDWGFWFGVTNTPHISGGHYDDYRHLEISGTFVHLKGTRVGTLNSRSCLTGGLTIKEVAPIMLAASGI